MASRTDSMSSSRTDSVSTKSGSKRGTKVQKKAFTRWINDNLKHTSIKVKDVEKDLDDGLVLIKLLESLVPRKQIPAR